MTRAGFLSLSSPWKVALHLARHGLDRDLTGDPGTGVFSGGRLRGFESICGVFLNGTEETEKQLADATPTLDRSRDAVQRVIVPTDRALARLSTGGPGATETSAAMLRECVGLVSVTRGRVPDRLLAFCLRRIPSCIGEEFGLRVRGPQTSVVWIARDGDAVLFSTTAGRQKARNLARDPRISLTVYDAENPYHSVDIRGTVELIEDREKALRRELSQKYLGEDPPPESDDVLRLIVRVIPRKVSGFSV